MNSNAGRVQIYLSFFRHKMADVKLGEELPHVHLVVVETGPGNLQGTCIWGRDTLYQPDT